MSEKLIILSDPATPTGDKSIWMLARYNTETSGMTILEFGEGEIPQRVLDMKEEAGR